MVIFDFTSSSIVLCLFLLMTAGHAPISLVVTIMVLLPIVAALYTPAVTASIPLLVEQSKLEGANGTVQAVQALSMVMAPIIGGLLYGALGVQALVIISCISFLLSAVMEIFIKIPFFKRGQDGHIIATIAKDLKEGFAYVVKQSFILKSMILAALINLVLSPLLLVGSSIILRVTMKSSDNMYGLGLGLINLALCVLPIALSVAPLILGIGYYPAFVILMLGAVPMAMIATMMSIVIIAKVQKVTPNGNLGKVMAILMAAAQCAAPLGQVIYGVLFKSFSAALYIPILAVSLIMLVIAGVSRQMLRNEVNV